MPAHPPPEAALIAARLAARVPHMSRREAARRAGISETRWRQIENGIIRVRGADYPEVAPAGTLARIALVVGITPAELESAGRPDAAAELAQLPPLPADGDGHAPITREEFSAMGRRLEELTEALNRTLRHPLPPEQQQARDINEHRGQHGMTG